MKCRQVQLAFEDRLDALPGVAAEPLGRDIQAHLELCEVCAAEVRRAQQSRMLLSALRREAEPAADPFFFTRLQARLRAQARPVVSFWHLGVGRRDLLVAMLIFLVSLGSFVYDVHRIERPSADEAIALDVPHVNTQHPSDDHRAADSQDVMLSLLSR